MLSFLLYVLTVLIACRKTSNDTCSHDHRQEDHFKPGVPRYSTPEEFTQGINRVAGLVAANEITAYRDTTPDGKPDIHGRKEALIQDVQQILAELHNGQTEDAVYDIFHFDGNTFSLISYLMKARMVNDISANTLTQILAEIPLPPVAVQGFTPPLVPVPVPEPVNPVACCKCDPKVKIRVTLVYVPDCGNYERKTTGYVVNNTLTGMSSGIYYQLVPEVEGCGCGGIWTYNIEAPAGASYASSYSGNPGNGVSFQGLSGGTYKITFTYTCGCGCGASDSETLSISIK
jgi:hypothetical protein